MKNGENKINKRYIKNLEYHIEGTKANIKYSLDRFDILIISLSSGGLIFSMGFIKDILPKDIEINFLLLKISWILFGASIMINLLSQVTGYYANKMEIKISKNIIRQEKKNEMIGNQQHFESMKKIFNSLTNVFNGLCLFFLIGGVVFLIIFVSANLN
ncbi:MAG: hypothetical protein EOM83_02435 [Clostridia bacterium]|nr:hypothetical protein [Clostridia bacterium]